MRTLVVGATGATGQLLVDQLLRTGQDVRVIVRSRGRLPESVVNHDRLSVIQGGLLEIPDDRMADHVEGCDAVASCLGHNVTFRGIFGQPRRLVLDATRRLCNAIKNNRPARPTKFVLMNTAGNRNRDLEEPVSFAERLVVGAVRMLLPPHADNERAADYLRTAVGQNDAVIEWAVVRPDSLTREGEVTDYTTHASPTRSAIFDPGKTNRIDVAHFMARLIADEGLWNEWRGHMPVVYSGASV